MSAIIGKAGGFDPSECWRSEEASVPGLLLESTNALFLCIGTLNQHYCCFAAPNFTAQAVVDGEFKSVSLSDYKGK